MVTQPISISQDPERTESLQSGSVSPIIHENYNGLGFLKK